MFSYVWLNGGRAGWSLRVWLERDEAEEDGAGGGVRAGREVPGWKGSLLHQTLDGFQWASERIITLEDNKLDSKIKYCSMGHNKFDKFRKFDSRMH